MRKNNTSGYRGIYPRRAKWLAKIHVNGVSRYCGTFATPQEAAAAYEAMAREVHGEFYRAPRLRT